MAEKILHPFGAADGPVTVTPETGVAAYTVKNSLAYINISMVAATTLNLTIEPGLPKGSRLVIRAGSDGTARALTPGTGMTGTAVSGTISKTNVIEAEYDGSTYVVKSARLID